MNAKAESATRYFPRAKRPPTLAEQIAERRAQIDPSDYERWLWRHCYKRLPAFWELGR